MNYKLIEKFIEIKEKKAVIENNSNGRVEIAIMSNDETPKEYNQSNKIIEPSGKFNYSLESNQKIYGRAYNRIYSMINVFEYENESSNPDFDPSQYYTKTQIDNTFAKKTGNVATATKLETTRNIKIEGDATGQTNFDGSEDVTISVEISNIDGNKITKMTGYTKADVYESISPSDSVITAISKLEKRTDSIGTGGGDNVPKTTQVIAGNGLSGGGALSENVTLNITSADDGITVNADNIKLNIVDDLVTDSSTRPASGKQVKKLHEEKLGKTEKAQSSNTSDTCTGNSATATKLEIQRAIKLTGAINGSANFDGSSDANITTTLSELDGDKINKLTGYTKAGEKSQIEPTDSLLTALGKLEKGLEGVAPTTLSTQGSPFSFYYCTKLEYESLEKIQDDSTIYLVLDESTGNIEIKVYKP